MRGPDGGVDGTGEGGVDGIGVGAGDGGVDGTGEGGVDGIGVGAGDGGVDGTGEGGVDGIGVGAGEPTAWSTRGTAGAAARATARCASTSSRFHDGRERSCWSSADATPSAMSATVRHMLSESPLGHSAWR